MAESVSGQEWGRATLKIQDALIVEEQAAESGIGEFYRANKTKTILAICRAVEGNPDVRLGEVEENFPLVPVTFYSQLGYQYFTSILKGHYLQKCLQEELQKIGYEEPIITSGERWELPNLPEGEMQSWELVSMGTRGIIEDRVMSWLDESYHTSGEEDIVGEAGPSQAKRARLHQQPPVHSLQQHWDSPTAKACLQTELEKVGYKEPINVNVEKWELPNLPEGEEGLLPSTGTTGILEGLERTANWVHGLPDKMTMASYAVGDSDTPDNESALLGSSTVTAGNSHDTSAMLASSTVTSREDLEESSHAGDSDIPDNKSDLLGSSTVTEEYSDGASATLASSTVTSLEGLQEAGPTQQQRPVQVTQLVKLQETPMRWMNAGLQQHVDKANFQKWVKAYNCLEKGAAKCLKKGAFSRYQELKHLEEGLELMREGFKLMREVSPGYVDTIQDEMQMYLRAVLATCR